MLFLLLLVTLAQLMDHSTYGSEMPHSIATVIESGFVLREIGAFIPSELMMHSPPICFRFPSIWENVWESVIKISNFSFLKRIPHFIHQNDLFESLSQNFELFPLLPQYSHICPSFWNIKFSPLLSKFHLSLFCIIYMIFFFPPFWP